jgi:hypothetical protein
MTECRQPGIYEIFLIPARNCFQFHLKCGFRYRSGDSRPWRRRRFSARKQIRKVHLLSSLERFNMPLGWILGFKTANRSLVNARIAGRRGRQPAHATPSQRFRLQLEMLETRCLLSAGDMLVLTTPPASIGWAGDASGVSMVAAGTPFGMTITAEKADGTVDTSYNGSVTIAPAGASNTPNGALTVTAINGVATFSGLTEDNVTWLSLRISGSGLPAAANATVGIFITVGPAAQLVVSRPEPIAYLQTQHSGPIDPLFYNPVSKAPPASPSAWPYGSWTAPETSTPHSTVP